MLARRDYCFLEFQSCHARDENRQQEGIQRPPLLEAVVIAASDGILESQPFVDALFFMPVAAERTYANALTKSLLFAMMVPFLCLLWKETTNIRFLPPHSDQVDCWVLGLQSF